MRIEPPPSVPMASGPRPAATAALAPPLEPPGVRSRFHGLRVGPKSRLWVAPIQPIIGVLVLPSWIAPAASHPLHHRRALGGHVVREEPRAERGADAAGDHEILGGERHPVQRAQTRPLLAHRALRGAGRLHGVLGGQGHEGVQARVEPLDAGQHRGHDLDGGDLAALDGGRHLGRGHPAEVVGSASHGKPPHPALSPGGEGCLVRRRAGADRACRGARRPAGSSRRRPG